MLDLVSIIEAFDAGDFHTVNAQASFTRTLNSCMTAVLEYEHLGVQLYLQLEQEPAPKHDDWIWKLDAILPLRVYN